MQNPISDRKEFMVILIRVEIKSVRTAAVSAKWTKKIEVAT